MRKKCFSDREKLLKLEAEGREFAKFLRSNSERSEQFLVTDGGISILVDFRPMGCKL